MMKGIRFAVLFTTSMALSLISANAQTPLTEASRKADIGPAWPGCDPKMPECTKSRLGDFIAANLQIPPEAQQQNTGGLIAMEFVIEKTGYIGEIHTANDPGMGLAMEAKRVIELLNTKKIRWVPAEKDGKKIAYRYMMPISFNIPAPAKEAKATPVSETPANGIYTIAEVMPRFAGCENSSDSTDCTFRKVLEYIHTQMKYPKEAMENKMEGKVVIEFVVSADGSVANPKIVQGIGNGCDEEALRLVTEMPAWSPGSQDGKPVAVVLNLPILFQLPKED
jgi:TonB family protein